MSSPHTRRLHPPSARFLHTSVRFLHTSDWQLGMTRRFLSEEAQARFTHDRIEAIRRIGRIAAERGARFVVVAGDVFESNQVERQTVARALDAMASVSVPVLLLPGNHDPLDAASVYRSPGFRDHRPANVVVLADGTPVQPPGVDGVEVVAAPWDSKRPLVDLTAQLAAGLEPCPPGRLRVAVAHGAVDALAPDVENPALVRLAAAEQAVADGRLHYLALGDRHSLTRVGDTGAIWYSGAPVATDYDEVRPGHVLVVDAAPGEPRASVSAEAVPVWEEGAWRFVDERFELNGPEDVTTLARFLADCPHKERAILRLSLVGSLSVAETARLDALWEEAEPVFASLRRWGRHTDLAVLPDALDADALALSGYARSAWDELASAAAEGGESAQAAGDALALFYRLARAEGRERTGSTP